MSIDKKDHHHSCLLCDSQSMHIQSMFPNTSNVCINIEEKFCDVWRQKKHGLLQAGARSVINAPTWISWQPILTTYILRIGPPSASHEFCQDIHLLNIFSLQITWASCNILLPPVHQLSLCRWLGLGFNNWFEVSLSSNIVQPDSSSLRSVWTSANWMP
jgi:hypothetical protein